MTFDLYAYEFRLREIDRVADWGELAAGFALAVAGPQNVEDLLVRLPRGVDPALDDLNTVEIGADRIFQDTHQE